MVNPALVFIQRQDRPLHLFFGNRRLYLWHLTGVGGLCKYKIFPNSEVLRRPSVPLSSRPYSSGEYGGVSRLHTAVIVWTDTSAHS